MSLKKVGTGCDVPHQVNVIIEIPIDNTAMRHPSNSGPQNPNL